MAHGQSRPGQIPAVEMHVLPEDKLWCGTVYPDHGIYGGHPLQAPSAKCIDSELKEVLRRKDRGSSVTKALIICAIYLIFLY